MEQLIIIPGNKILKENEIIMGIIFRYLSDVCIDRFCKEFIGGDSIKFKNNTAPEVEVLPFLKLRPKLHKLTKHELKMRDTRQLKYRPVVDASRTPINPYAKSLMDYLRELIRRAETEYFEGEKTMAKNGHEIAKFLDKIGKPSTRGKYYAVADLSSAYTFIFLKNLLVAMNHLGKELEIPDWKMTMFE
jgi:hypothetical protein